MIEAWFGVVGSPISDHCYAVEIVGSPITDMENAVEIVGSPITYWENFVEIGGSPRHFKMMCNEVVNGKRLKTNSKTSKSIVEACAEDGIHLANAFGENGEAWNCVGESEAVRVGDIAHMYHGDMNKGNSKHYCGKVLSTYEKLSDSVWEFAAESGFSHVKEVWPGFGGKRVIFCRVAWEEVAMTAEDEDMIKHPEKKGFKAQGTILQIR
jgi:hypothetical protein